MPHLQRFTLFILVLLLGGCQSRYEKIEREELASGKIVKDLFLGLELGMSRKDFFETCWKRNSEGILTNGPTELSVEYKTTLPSGNPATMRFYPEFEEDKIYLMPMEFSYEAWSPLNEDLEVEKLRPDVIAFLEQWYGPGFFEVSNQDKNLIAFVKIDGNRRIRVFKKHLSTVRVEIIDLKTQKKLESESL